MPVSGSRHLILLAVAGAVACAGLPSPALSAEGGLSEGAGAVHLQASPADSIRVAKPALFPEGIDYDAKSGKFLLGSFREGAVYAVGPDGKAERLVNDPRLSSVLGVRVDAARNRLLAANSDLGAAQRPYAGGPRKLASIGAYALDTGKPLFFVELGHLSAGPDHLANDLAVDAQGNAYVTDSFSPVIYKVDPEGRASVFIENDAFRAKGIGLNGIVVHPDGFLIVTKKDDGSLFKIPLDHPEAFTKVKVDGAPKASDGLVLAGKDDLVVVCNKTPDDASNAVASLRTSDHWASARVTGLLPAGDVYPTTGTIKDGRLYFLHSNLNRLIAAPRDRQDKLDTSPVIEAVGSVSPGK